MGNMELSNRFVRSATWEGMAAEDGGITDDLVALYRDLAKGKVGLIILSCASVDPRGKGLNGLIGIHSDSHIPGLKRLTDTVHEEGGKIVAQIYHAGAQMSIDSGFPVEAPSAVPAEGSGKVPVEMTPADIARVVKAFADAAQRAKESGFDGIQLHCAHGYLLSEFLSPSANVRTDAYGGPIENRARMVFEVYDAVRQRTGSDYLVLVKINVEDFHDAGLGTDDSLWICEQLAAKGIDAIELSGGTPAAGRNGAARTKIFEPDKEAYFKEHAKRFTPRLKCPVILVGGVRSVEVIEGLYTEGTAQFFSMSRPFISEPDLIKRWSSGDKRKARCASCNKCFATASRAKRIYCAGFAKLDGLQLDDIAQND